MDIEVLVRSVCINTSRLAQSVFRVASDCVRSLLKPNPGYGRMKIPERMNREETDITS